MPTTCETPGRSAPPPGAVLPVARAVAEDLEAIFPHEPRPDASQTLRLRDRRRRGGPAAERRGSISSAGTLGALAAATLAGLSAGAFLGSDHAPHARATQAQVVLTSNSALPSPGPLPAGPLHAPPPRILVAAPEPAAAPSPARLHKASAQRLAAQRLAAQRRRATPTHRASCHYPYCRAPTVMEADARLRRAYDAARQAGVSSTVLTDYHDRWESLRRRAPREPRLVAARYDEMAGDLNRMAARHATDDRTRTHHGAWYSLRTQIAALWR
ncbi:MAG TPA: hypothetical protein VJS38_14315 [Phenylobacterium sp.]|uniref:hypothetical protein n=1 Tax=Phenylobacterium sp. TaxID=1871053 RepID=UPI002B45F386|nr:hypothetical protein [Phenylobacterium sp.]HKR89341.1 hypothetical protein [Phenylobacterium sp.]